MKKRSGILKRELASGVEFALSVIVLIFIGYFLGNRLDESMAVIGMVLGAFLGFILGTYRLVKRFSNE